MILISFQALLLSILTTELVLSLAIAEKESSANPGIVGSLYPRSSALKQAPLPEKEITEENAPGSVRGQRCVKCSGGGGYGTGYGNYGNYGGYYGGNVAAPGANTGGGYYGNYPDR